MTQIPENPVPQAQQYPKPRRRRLNRLMLVAAAVGLLVLIFISITGYFVRRDLGQKRASVASAKKIFGQTNQVGVLEVNGVIREVPVKRWLKTLKQFRDDESVKAIVLRINSPGGAVAPSQELYNELLKVSAKKPVVASMASVAASGGYYIAVAAPTIFANPGTITGSIGVIMEFANLEKLYDWAKVQRFSIKTGKFKDAGADYRKMDEEERRLLQGMIDTTLVDFKAAVAKGRKLSATEVDAVADGRIFSGSQAKAAKLVDELGGLQEAIDAAAKAAKIEGEPRVVYRHKEDRGGFLRWFFEQIGDRKSDDDDEDARASGTAPEAWLVGLIKQAIGIDSASTSQKLEPGIYWLLPWGY